jgi:mono/diheme cytochrome c family protein
MIRRSALLVAALALAVTACGGDSSSEDTAPDVGSDITVVPDGEELFKRTVLANNGGCVACHSLTPDKVLVGPSLADIGVTAADRVAGTSASDYLLESITDPDAFVVEGFDAGRMPDDWTEGLSTGEIAALVDYMLTLGAG